MGEVIYLKDWLKKKAKDNDRNGFENDLKIIAYLLPKSGKIIMGSEIAIEINKKIYVGKVLEIIERDKSGNVKTIFYNIPFLSGDDPLKMGIANLRYEEKIIE